MIITCRYIVRTLLFLSFGFFSVWARGQELPEGEGRDALITACTICHGLGNITNPHRKFNAEEWEFHLYDMISRGAPIYEKDVEMVKRYLIDNFAVE